MTRAQIIEQPNGLLSVFNPAIESWVIWDSTPEELVTFFTEEAARRAEQVTLDVIKGVTQDDPRSIYGRDTLTFKQANDRHLANDGTEVFRPDDFADQGISL